MQESGGLRQLQDELKRQYLLLEREQREKSKIKKLIETIIQDYYSSLVEKKGLGKVVSEDKLGNSYTFVKDLILNISKDVVLGVQVLIKCPLDMVEKLTSLLLGMFYENFSQNDPYIKKSTKFAEVLGKKIVKWIFDVNFIKQGNSIDLMHFFSNENQSSISQILAAILRKFVEIESIKQYFQMLANRTLNRIPNSMRFDLLKMRTGNSNLDVGENIEQLSENLEAFSIENPGLKSQDSNDDSKTAKIDEIVEQYKLDILSKAQMMPISLRTLCFSLFQQFMNSNKNLQKKTVYEFIWQILKKQYFRPFDSNTLTMRKLSMFKNSFFGEIVGKIREQAQLKMNENFISKVVEKVINMDREKLILKEEESKRKITLNGGCINYENLYLLFKVIKEHDKDLKEFSERVTNRVNKIYEMSPDFESFKNFEEADRSYLLFTEVIYGQIIQKDYQSIYNSVYSNNMIKNMLKQILSDTSFHILPFIHKHRSLKDILQLISREQELESDGSFSLGVLQHTAQFNMKIKYLVFLMKKQEVEEESLFQEMINDCRKRQKENVILFERNKMLLLQCLTSLSKSKQVVEKQKFQQRKVEIHLKTVKTLDIFHIDNLCISAPSTRQKFAINEAEFTKGITILNTEKVECVHQNDFQEGLKYHPTNLHSLLDIFCSLKQVSECMETGKDSKCIYQSLCQMLDQIRQKCRTSKSIKVEEYGSIERSVSKIVMREIHARLIEEKQQSEQDLKLKEILNSFAQIKQSEFKIDGINCTDQLQQLWQIACRYLKSLNDKRNPVSKLNSLVEMLQIVKISLHGDDSSRDPIKDKKNQEMIIAYCMIKSKPSKIIANINFIQLFLSKDKLVSREGNREGNVLQKVKNAISLIKDSKTFSGFIRKSENQLQQQIRTENDLTA